MEYFRPDVKVGGLLFATLVLIVVAALSVGSLGSWFAPKQHFIVLFRNANLLTEGVRVAYAGYPVGQVKAVTIRSLEARSKLHPEYPVAVSIGVRSTVPVRTDSRIEMKTDGVIGDRYIDIYPGFKEAVAPGSTILGSLGGVDGLLASFSGGDSGIQDMIGALTTLLTDTSQPNSIPSTLRRVQQLLDTLPTFLPPITAAVDDLGQQIQNEIVGVSQVTRQLLGDVQSTLAENRGGVRRLIGELNQTMDKTRYTMEAAYTLLKADEGDVPRFLKEVRGLVGSIQNNRETLAAQIENLLADLDTVVVQNDRNLFVTIENLRDMSAHLATAAEIVRANPAVIVWGNEGEDGPQVRPVAGVGPQSLKDRGRIGRYDRVR